jgi:hypothetical protein
MAGSTSVTETPAQQQISAHQWNQLPQLANTLTVTVGRIHHHANTSRHSKHKRSSVTTYPRSPFDTTHLGGWCFSRGGSPLIRAIWVE